MQSCSFGTPDSVIDKYCNCLEKNMSDKMSFDTYLEVVNKCEKQLNKSIYDRKFSSKEEEYIRQETIKCGINKTIDHGGKSIDHFLNEK